MVIVTTTTTTTAILPTTTTTIPKTTIEKIDSEFFFDQNRGQELIFFQGNLKQRWSEFPKRIK